MKTNETGEFELVLGNRQLLSGFFLVALLFGVAFAMGYIVGRNSTPSPKLQADAAASATPTPQDVRPHPVAPGIPPTASEQTPAPADSPNTDNAATEARPAPAQPSTVPAKEGPAAAPPPPAATPAPASTPDSAPAAEPPPGTYWQVSAIATPQAEVFAKVLRNQGFHVTLTQGPKNLTRVLVGPYPDTQALGRAKSDLESAGFHPVILKKE
jgi:cell division protein FtsN